MSQYNQNQSAEAYPAPPSSALPTLVAPPPVGYPMGDGTVQPQSDAPIETKTRGPTDAALGWCSCLASWASCMITAMSCAN
ncbi:cysteine-rich and transmembrane domain-containing protein PCC1-like isoform X2 [Tripterygium wilfordii]|uniref:cysteine-rich and transmembrane domain-containing protein PCC1-like isoform X2 n=1 Tax=Tripterygium wilfordii TaxID=458696 RepID=UPI0018F86278|nr:cysteine-rich and transmembrane domain-containing protein PCC1-like isoform X2 [Tripterygium wilfordii]